MPEFVTPEERARALALVHSQMLQALWIEVLRRYDEPDEEALAIAGEQVRALEGHLADPRAGVSEDMRGFAVRTLEDMWLVIRTALAGRGRGATFQLPDPERSS